MVCKYLLPSLMVTFYFSFAVAEAFQHNMFPLAFLSLMKSLPQDQYHEVFLHFLLGVLQFQVLWKFELIFCMVQDKGPISFCMWMSSFLNTICWGDYPWCIFGILAEDQLTVYVRIYFWALYSVSLSIGLLYASIILFWLV